jgi:hypothetical protein
MQIKSANAASGKPRRQLSAAFRSEAKDMVRLLKFGTIRILHEKNVGCKNPGSDAPS